MPDWMIALMKMPSKFHIRLHCAVFSLAGILGVQDTIADEPSVVATAPVELFFSDRSPAPAGGDNDLVAIDKELQELGQKIESLEDEADAWSASGLITIPTSFLVYAVPRFDEYFPAPAGNSLAETLGKELRGARAWEDIKTINGRIIIIESALIRALGNLDAAKTYDVWSEPSGEWKIPIKDAKDLTEQISWSIEVIQQHLADLRRIVKIRTIYKDLYAQIDQLENRRNVLKDQREKLKSAMPRTAQLAYPPVILIPISMDDKRVSAGTEWAIDGNAHFDVDEQTNSSGQTDNVFVDVFENSTQSFEPTPHILTSPPEGEDTPQTPGPGSGGGPGPLSVGAEVFYVRVDSPLSFGLPQPHAEEDFFSIDADNNANKINSLGAFTQNEGGSCNPCIFDPGTATHVAGGRDDALAVEWGRWEGDYTFTVDGSPAPIGGPLQYVFAERLTPKIELPVAGTMIYGTISGTPGVFHNVAGAGTLDSVSVTANFSTSRLTALDITGNFGPGKTFTASRFGGFLIQNTGTAGGFIKGTCAAALCGAETNLEGLAHLGFVGTGGSAMIGSFGLDTGGHTSNNAIMGTFLVKP